MYLFPPLKTLPKATVPSEWCEDPTSMSEYDGTIMFQVQHLPWSRVTPQPRPQLSEIWIQAGVIAPAAPSSRDGENSSNSPGSQNKLQQKGEHHHTISDQTKAKVPQEDPGTSFHCQDSCPEIPASSSSSSTLPCTSRDKTTSSSPFTCSCLPGAAFCTFTSSYFPGASPSCTFSCSCSSPSSGCSGRSW